MCELIQMQCVIGIHFSLYFKVNSASALDQHAMCELMLIGGKNILMFVVYLINDSSNPIASFLQSVNLDH